MFVSCVKRGSWLWLALLTYRMCLSGRGSGLRISTWDIVGWICWVSVGWVCFRPVVGWLLSNKSDSQRDPREEHGFFLWMYTFEKGAWKKYIFFKLPFRTHGIFQTLVFFGAHGFVLYGNDWLPSLIELTGPQVYARPRKFFAPLRLIYPVAGVTFNLARAYSHSNNRIACFSRNDSAPLKFFTLMDILVERNFFRNLYFCLMIQFFCVSI